MKSIFIFFTFLVFYHLSALGTTLDEVFSEKYINSDEPYKFLLEHGINVDENILHLSSLKKIKKKRTGHCKGGIYRDSNHTTYYVKKCHIFNEIIGSSLMNLIVGTKCTPIVKVIKNHRKLVASTKIKSFKMHKKVITFNKEIINEVELQIAMDFLGLVDRHPRNMGYIRLNSRTLLACRVDFDFCFDFESKKGYTSRSDHLSLKHLRSSIKKYPKDKIIKAIQKILEIPDEKILMTIFQSWVTLSRSGTKIPCQQCLELYQKLIERKNIFRQAIENPKCSTYQLLHK